MPSQYEAKGDNCLLLKFLTNNDFTSNVMQAWTKWSKFQPITTSLGSFFKNVLKLSHSMQNSKTFPGEYSGLPIQAVGREGKFVFVPQKCRLLKLSAAMQNYRNFLEVLPLDPVLMEEEGGGFCFRSPDACLDGAWVSASGCWSEGPRKVL